ncbi:MAG: SIS domain-containing protein [Bryobacteraceae bacterium]
MNLEELWRECSYLKDLLEQPEAVARTMAGLEEQDSLAEFAQGLRAGRWRRVVLTGMGSSYWACHPLYLRLLAAGLTPVLVETSELIHFESDWLRPDTLVVAVSQSGRSVETVRLLEMARGKAEVLGITNTADSPLARQSAGALLTRAGVETTVACKTYAATLIALEWLGDLLCGTTTAALKAQAEPAVEAMRRYLSGWPAHVGELMRTLEGVQDVFVVGRGTALAAAGMGGLILKESTHYHGEGMSAAAYRHGPFEMVSDAVFVAILEGDERSATLSRKLAADIREAGGRAAVVSTEGEGAYRIPASGGRVRPLIEILPVEMMTLALATAKGREPGRFERLTKVTVVE